MEKKFTILVAIIMVGLYSWANYVFGTFHNPTPSDIRILVTFAVSIGLLVMLAAIGAVLLGRKGKGDKTK